MGFWVTKLSSKKTQRDNRVSIVPDYLGSATRAIYYKYPQKENPCVNPGFRETVTHAKLQPTNQTMSKQISGLISRYMTNSTRKILHKQTRNLTGYCDNEEIRPLSWTSLRKGAMDQGATSAAMSYSRRRDAATTHVTAGGPTLRRTAAPQTHATQHGLQRQRSRYRPTDSLQLPADQRPGTVDNVGGLISARRTCFSSPG